jgi:hypothetical protein
MVELRDLIGVFSERMGLGSLDPDKDGAYTVVFDDRLSVRCLPAGKDEIILSGAIGEIPEDERKAEEHLKKVLKFNLSRMKIQKEVLAFVPETRELICYLKARMNELTGDDFMELMENFLNTFEFWTESAKDVPATAPQFFLLRP